MLAFWTSILSALAAFAPTIAAAFGHKPVPSPSNPAAAPGWAGIEGEEDAAAARRTAEAATGAPRP